MTKEELTNMSKEKIKKELGAQKVNFTAQWSENMRSAIEKTKDGKHDSANITG